MKKKGFTLIELLAVIVILAIIALIAVPVIMNIITSARKSAFEDTAYGLISAGEMYYAGVLLDSGMNEDVEFTIEDGEFVGDDKLEVKGALPTSGKVKVTKVGDVVIAINNGTYCATKTKSESMVKIEDYEGSCEYRKTANPIIRLNESCLTNGSKCEEGTELVIQVNETETKTFYVVKDDVNSNMLTLIMNSNIGNSEWINKNDYINAGGLEENFGDFGNYDKGPLTALNKLESLTSGWLNIDAKNYQVTDSKFGTITRESARARLLTKTEALSLGCDNFCPDWLYINSYGGHWLSDSLNTVSHAWRIYYDGNLFEGIVVDSENGVRPVIEIPKMIV